MSATIGSAAASGLSLYALIKKSSNRYVWNGATFEAFTSGNWASYKVNFSEDAGDYWCNFPTGIPAGLYLFIVYTGTGVFGDIVYDRGEILWDGSEELTLLSPIAELSTIPGANAGIRDLIKFLGMGLRNRMTSTRTARALYSDTDVLVGSAPCSDDNVTFDQGKMS